jgi:3-deoxy-7-phosphoheptulonate synthase
MILHLHKSNLPQPVNELAASHQAVWFEADDHFVFVLSSSVKEVPHTLEKCVQTAWSCESDIQLASKNYRKNLREVSWGKTRIGGDTQNTVMIAGPCSAESEAQLDQSAQLLAELGISNIRAGAFKPRTSPYTFQGLGEEGLKMLADIRQKYGFSVVTEVRDATQLELVIEYADVIQIGAKSMYDHGILRRCGKTQKPVLIKRGFGTTLQEFVQCAEFILSGGNPNVMLCERGIRTFETKTRFTLDLCGVAYLKEHTNLPVILDPSHAMGYAYGVADLTRACMAMGVDGLLVEVHPTPKTALSDASQQLDHGQFRSLVNSLKPIAAAVNRNLV